MENQPALFLCTTMLSDTVSLHLIITLHILCAILQVFMHIFFSRFYIMKFLNRSFI